MSGILTKKQQTSQMASIRPEKRNWKAIILRQFQGGSLGHQGNYKVKKSKICG